MNAQQRSEPSVIVGRNFQGWYVTYDGMPAGTCFSLHDTREEAVSAAETLGNDWGMPIRYEKGAA